MFTEVSFSVDCLILLKKETHWKKMDCQDGHLSLHRQELGGYI